MTNQDANNPYHKCDQCGVIKGTELVELEAGPYSLTAHLCPPHRQEHERHFDELRELRTPKPKEESVETQVEEEGT